MKRFVLLPAALFALTLPACSLTPEQASAREWQKAECNKILDQEAREKCMKRVD